MPKIHRLRKTHELEILLRLLISCIGSVPHKSAKSLAKILIPLLDAIDSSHVRNSGIYSTK